MMTDDTDDDRAVLPEGVEVYGGCENTMYGGLSAAEVARLQAEIQAEIRAGARGGD